MARVSEIVDRSAGDRITNHPQLHTHYGDTLEAAIEKACAEAERLLSRFTEPLEVARLVVDSEQVAAPAGLRTGRSGARKLLYATGGHLIDVQVQPVNGGSRIVLIGQITSPEHP